jgi:tetratricopeptide (TPR) repeat protein
MKAAPPSANRGRSGLWAYNLRILVGNTYWLIVTPVAATQIVIFWNIATKTLFNAGAAAQTVELLAPILAAFLCAHALAAEQDGVGELVFVRPVSVEKVLLLRLAVIFCFVFAVLTPAFVIYLIGIDDLALGTTLLAAVPSMLFLSLLAMDLASAFRNPMLGFAGAGAFWAIDVTVGGYFNPLVSLQAYARFVGAEDMSEQWLLSKAVLLVLAGLLYVWQRRMLGTPPAPRRWTAAVRTAIAVALLALAYVTSGAAYKVAYGISHEGEMGYRARLWYQRQFSGYGPIPVAWMFGKAFPLYVQAEVRRDVPLADAGGRSLISRVDLDRMRSLVTRFPDSVWADNAQFEIASAAARRTDAGQWSVAAYQAGRADPTLIRVAEDVDGAAEEYQALVDRYPESPFAPLALAQRAAIGLRVLDFDMARSAYGRLVEQHPESAESYRAGMDMGALLLREGAFEEARQAAEVAAQLGPWDTRPEALLLAAEAVHGSGDEARAREHYQRARDAAVRAYDRAVAAEKIPSDMAKHELFERLDAVVHICEAALAGRGSIPTALPAEAEVVGRLVRDGAGVAGARVAIGRSPSEAGLPSPFVEGPAASAVTDEEGRFDLGPLPRGSYDAAAVAVPVGRDDPGAIVRGLAIPLEVDDSPITLSPIEVGSEPDVRAARRDGFQGASEPLLGEVHGPPRGRGGGPGGRMNSVYDDPGRASRGTTDSERNGFGRGGRHSR